MITHTKSIVTALTTASALASQLLAQFQIVGSANLTNLMGRSINGVVLKIHPIQTPLETNKKTLMAESIITTSLLWKR